MSAPTLEEIRAYWDSNPLCASDIPHALGTPEYFAQYDIMREEIESLEFSYRLHEYRNFSGRRVLDVGVGNGYVLGKYAIEGAEVSGVDVTPTAIDLCSKRFQHLGLGGDFRVAPAEQLPFADATFDCVCSMGVLHHVSDTPRALAEIHRVLKPGGRLIVMFYHRNSIQYQVKYRLVSLLTGRSRKQMVNEFDGAGNPRGDVYSRRELAAMLSRFESIETFVWFLTKGMFVPRGARLIPRWLVRAGESRFGWNLYAKARKPAKDA